MTATVEVLAGNVARITSTLTALDAPLGDPTAVVCITGNDGTLIEGALMNTVDTVGSVVTVVADWEIPDDQTGGLYVATVDTAGSLVAADEVRFYVEPRLHTDPH